MDPLTRASATLVAAIERVLGAVALFSYRRRTAVLVLAVVATAGAGFFLRRLKIDTDVVHLLPESFESVENLHRFSERSYGVGYVSVVVEGGSPAQRQKFADHVAPRLAALDTVQYVDFKRPNDFFDRHSLYYLEREELQSIVDRFEERRMWEVRSRSDMYDLELEPLGDPPSLAFDDLQKKYEDKLREFGVSPRSDSKAKRTYLGDDDALILLARPSQRSTAISFNKQVVSDVDGVLRAVPPEIAADLRWQLSGRYKKKLDQKAQIESDLKLASVLAAALMLLYLGLHFRRASAVTLVIVPLLIGVVWSLGLAAGLFGSLNILTSFIGALLLGLGIDHGIHLLARIEHEQFLTPDDPERAVVTAFGTTGRAVVVAALTTVAAFFGVAISEFRAFREFGVIAGAGLLFIVLAYTLVLPALLGFRRKKEKPADIPPSPFAEALPKWAPWPGWIAGLLLIAAVLGASDNRFDYDFASLEDSNLPAFQLDKRVNRILGRSQTPLVVLADTPAHETQIAAALRSGLEDRSITSVQTVLGLADLVPDAAAEKKPILDELAETLKNTKESWLDEEQLKKKKRLEKMAKAEPFDRASMPDVVSRQFLGRDPKTTFVLVYPNISLSDGVAVRRLATELRAVKLDDGRPLVIAGEAMVLADVLDMVTREAPVVGLITLGVVLLVLLIFLGPSLLIPCSLSAGATLAITAGLMPRLGLQFNYLNIIMAPVLFGLAVDGAVHVLVQHRSTGSITEVISETGRAVAGALLTTMFGFGAFLLAHHPGLNSLGRVALLGLAVNIFVTLVALPSALVLYDRARKLAAQTSFKSFGTELLVTCGLAGHAPVGPGTLGALLALPIAAFASAWSLGPKAALVVVVVVLSTVWTAGYLRRTKSKDPSEVVIDELAGCLIALLMVPTGLGWTVAAFVLFRLFDIFKPFPVNYIDERAPGAWGVMFDDVLAGVMAGAALIGLNLVGQSQGWWA